MVPQIVFTAYKNTRIGIAYFSADDKQQLLAVEDFKNCEWVFDSKQTGYLLDKPGLYLLGIDTFKRVLVPVAGKDMKFVKTKLNSICKGKKGFNVSCIASASLNTLIQKFLDVHGKVENSVYTPVFAVPKTPLTTGPV